MRAICAALVAILVVLALALARPSAAQEEPSGISYITPFPEGDVYKLQAYGDGFAEGLLNGLVEAFAGDGRVQVSRKHRPLLGLTRPEFDDEMKAEEAPGRETFHIGVVMIGLADRNHIRTSPRDRALLGTDEWRNEYGRRVDRFIKTLKKRGVAVYWVGQPVMRRPEVNEPAQAMNDIAREKAYLNGAKFIDIQAHFADEGGNYAPYGPDITGKQRLLREADGVLFTYFGYRKLAHFVEQEIKRDLLQAKNERAIPLAGNEAEQKRVNSLKPRTPSSRRQHVEGDGHRVEGRQGRTAEVPGASQGSAGGRYLERSKGRQRPHHAEEHRRRRPGGIGDDRHPAPGDTLGRDRPDDPQGHGRSALADGRRGRRRSRWRARGSELDHAGRHRPGHQPAGRGTQPQPLLHGPDQRRAAHAEAGTGRRFLLAAGRSADRRRASRADAAAATLVLAQGRIAAELKSLPISAGRCGPSGSGRWHARPGGLRGSPTRRATGRGECRLRRTSSDCP